MLPLTWWTTSLMLYIVHVMASSLRRMSAAPGEERLRTNQHNVAVLSEPSETTLFWMRGAAAMIVKTAWANSRTFIVSGGAGLGMTPLSGMVNSWKKDSMASHSSSSGGS